MKIYNSYQEISPSSQPFILTIGKYEAVHLGHCALLKYAREVADRHQGELIVLTFTKNPTEFLRRNLKIPKICTLEQRLELLCQQKVDRVILQDFNQKLAEQNAEEFLIPLHEKLKFRVLILGNNALLGRDRQGDALTMRELAKRLGYHLEYVPLYKNDHHIISSSSIRESILKGNLNLAEEMLGRKYEIRMKSGKLVGGEYIFTLLPDICLPPSGLYPACLHNNGMQILTFAHIKREPLPIIAIKAIQPLETESFKLTFLN